MRLHVELTNRCVIACPACPRTEWQTLLKRPVEKADLDIESLVQFLDCPGGAKISSLILCGDYGDSIYYPYLMEFLQRFRQTKSFTLVTNGSHRDAKFWHQLTEILDQRDRVIFCIDGLEDTNAMYRINSNWSSVMQALDIVSKSSVRTRWKSIVFGHNYHQLSAMKALAESKGCEFVAEKTHRFGKDEFRPPNYLVETNHEYKDNFNNDHSIEIEPRCTSERTVTCDGYLFPCDWIRNPRTLYKSQLWKQKSRWLEKLNIKKTNFDDATKVVQDWANWVRQSSLSQSAEVDVLCKMKCRKGCVSNNSVEVA